MSYTTVSFDWEAYGPRKRSRSEPPLLGPEIPPVSIFTSLVAPTEGDALSPQGPENESSNEMMTTLASTENAREEDTFAPSETVVLARSKTNTATPMDLTQAIDQLYPAGQDAATRQTVTIEDTDITPSQRAFMARGMGRGMRGWGVSRGDRGSRGGRPPKIQIEPPQEDRDSETAPPRKVNRGGRPRGSRAGQSSAMSTPRVNRGGRPRGSRAGLSASTARGGSGRGGSGAKRKRKSGDHEEDEDGNSDSSEEITALPTQSRSGRRITQVVTPLPIEPDVESTLKSSLTKRSSLASPLDPTSSKKPAKRKRVTLSAVCKNCARGHSPQSNQIVFCDGCNTPWHQYCHDRPITPTVILEEEKEWHCADCEVHAEEARYMVGRIPPAEGMGLAEKRRALEAMEKVELVALLLRASTLHPDLAILKPPPPPETWTAAATAAAAAAASAAVSTAAVTAPLGAVAKGEAEFEYFDEPLPYPRAGNGLRLPPEEDDLGLLIDDDVITYSHSWIDRGVRTGAMGEAGGGFGGPGPTGVPIDVAA